MSNSVNHWLEDIGLSQYAEQFAQNDIDWSLLPALDQDTLVAMGIESAGHRLRILRAAQSLFANSNETALAQARDDVAAIPDSADSQNQAERRQLTVMFCDLVGSTALAQQLDPEALRDLMRAYQKTCGQIIERYDGHVAQYLGDGLMTYFGWPRAHEDDAERSIRAGLEMVEAVKQVPALEPLQVRIGIATGAVVVGATGAGDASVPKLAVGETPNLAARLQGLAQADQIIVSPDTRRLVGGTFGLDDVGEQTLKGIVAPVHAWRVTGLVPAHSRFDAAHGQALTPLVGREEELGMLQRRWQLAREGEGQVVLLSGEPGMGKSRLLNTLSETLKSDGVKAMRFQCSPYSVNSAFGPSIHSFERALKLARDESPDSKLDKLESLIVGHFGRPLNDVRFMASMLSIVCDQRYDALAMTPQKFKDETLRTLVDLTEAAAKKQPSILLYEDAHWADPSSLEMLDLLVDRVKSMPLLIVLTHRPEFKNRWADHDHVTGLNLSRLTRSQSGALTLRVTGGKRLPDDLFEQVLNKTDGVPLFVEELTLAILESGELTVQGDHYDYFGSSNRVSVPATLRDSLMARLDRNELVKEIAQIGATIGREFSHDMIADVAPLSILHLDEALIQLTESGLAFRRGTPPDAVYTFKHALVQDAAYDSLLKSRRQDLHRQIAQVIEDRFTTIQDNEPEVLAHHLTAAGESERAIPLWRRAGEVARERMALTESISHLNQGLRLIETLPACAERDAIELDLRIPLAMVWMMLRGWAAPEVWAGLDSARALAMSLKSNNIHMHMLSGLQASALCQGRVAESLPYVNEIMKMAKRTRDAEMLIPAYVAAASAYLYLGRFAAARRRCEKTLAIYRKDLKSGFAGQTLNPQTFALQTMASATLLQGYSDQALKMWNEAIAVARTGGQPFELGFALTVGADIFTFRGEFEPCRQCLEECEKLGRDNSLPMLWAMWVPTRRGVALIRSGQAAEGIGMIEAGSAVWEAGGGRSDLPLWRSILADGMAQLGDVDGALLEIDESIKQVERPGWEEQIAYAEILRLKGWMLTLKGDFAGAEQSYLSSLDCARQQLAKSWEVRTSISLARLWQQQGKGREAIELLKPVYDWFTEGLETADLIEAKLLLDELG